MIYQDTMNQQRLIRFLARFVRTAKRKVFLILDNLQVHHGKLVAAWLEKRQCKIKCVSYGNSNEHTLFL